jgi:hypothetical protein
MECRQRGERDQALVHLGDKALFDDEVTDIPGSIRAPAKTDERSAVRPAKDSVGHKELRHRFHDLRKGWGTIRLVLWCRACQIHHNCGWRR